MGTGNPYENEKGIGFVPTPIIRSLGVPLVTGDIPGVAVVIGKAENPADVVGAVKDYQSKGILTFLVGDVIDQVLDGGVKAGLEFRVIPLGHDVFSVILVVTVAIRAALIFGNVQPGDLGDCSVPPRIAYPLCKHIRCSQRGSRIRGAGAIALASRSLSTSTSARIRFPRA